MSHPAKSLPPAPRLIAHVGANWQHDLLEQARINSQRGNGCSCSAGVLGHARDWFSVSQVMPEAAQAQVREGLQKVRVRVCHSPCVSQSVCVTVCVCHRQVTLASAPLPLPAAMLEVPTVKPAPQLSLGLPCVRRVTR